VDIYISEQQTQKRKYQIKMPCKICSSTTELYFEKQFVYYGFETKYMRCTNCGFVTSSAHEEMSQDTWEKVNYKYHNSYHGSCLSPDDKRWGIRIQKQAQLIAMLHSNGLLREGNYVDYGSGDGKLSKQLRPKGIKLLRYDLVHYDKDDYCIDLPQLESRKYQLITLTSVIEHLRTYKEIEDIFSLVAENGCLAIHTFISTTSIPNDSSWFYLLPVHCAFHTNQSMKILAKRFGFTTCAYNYDARMWFLFKALSDKDKNTLEQLGVFDVCSSEGWVDYYE